MLNPVKAFALTVAIAVTACDGHDATVDDRQESVDQYALHAIDSIVLAETEDVYLGKPTSMAIAESGEIYVADSFSNRVLHYDSDGKLLGVIGAPGRGPGELEFVYTTFITDSSIVVVEGRNRTFEFFDRFSGVYQHQLSVSGLPGNTVPSQRGDTLWLGLRNAATNTALVRWIAGDSGVAYLGKLPTEYAEFPNIARATGIAAVRVDSLLIVGFGPLNGLIVYDLKGESVDTITVPRRVRRGVSRQALRESGGLLTALANNISTFWAMERVTDKLLAVVHYDNFIAEEMSPIHKARIFVTMLDLRNRRACVDREVVFTGDTHPVVQLKKDSLFVLTQSVYQDTVTSSIHVFHLDLNGCVWLKLDQRGILVD